ncbi:unnamed protein product [Cladocopium goreaui]|uniref:Uncharacterized protein n=1 Tax=Cladocopium goreaui TaxID=2562237 RepID=A0A9P1DHR0_9DINO|nr:unnamed protein product [Cladocopium goreaui]
MENMERGLDKAKFTKLVVAVLGEHLNDAKEVRMISTRLWNEILKEQDKTPPKRKTGKSNWAAWSEKKKQRDGEKAEQNGMPKPVAQSALPSPQKKPRVEKVIKREVAQSALPSPQKPRVRRLTILKKGVHSECQRVQYVRARASEDGRASSMCAHVSCASMCAHVDLLRARFLRACAQEGQRVQSVGQCSFVVQDCAFSGNLPGTAARTFFARMCTGMAARPVCARLCPFAHMDAGWAGVVSCGWLACLPVVATLQEEKTVSEQAVSAQDEKMKAAREEVVDAKDDKMKDAPEEAVDAKDFAKWLEAQSWPPQFPASYLRWLEVVEDKVDAEWQLSTAHNPVLVLRSRRPIAAFKGELAVNLVAAGDRTKARRKPQKQKRKRTEQCILEKNGAEKADKGFSFRDEAEICREYCIPRWSQQTFGSLDEM